MNSLIIDLSPKTEEFNTAAGNGRKVLRNVHFRINVDFYTYTFGYSQNDENSAKGKENTKKYFDEVVSILQADGWSILDEEYKKEHSGHCPQLKNGVQTLYCHPQDISGNIEVDNIEHLEELFSTAQTFKHYHTDNYRNIIVCSDIEDIKKLYHEKKDGIIADIIKELSTTKRCNLYKSRSSVESATANRVHVDTLIAGKNFANSTYYHYEYASDTINRLITEGWIKTAKGRDGNEIIRWANKAEEKAILKTMAAA